MAGMLKLIHALPQLLRKNASGHGIQTVGAVNFADRSRRLSRTEAPPVLQMLTRGGNHSSILSRFGRSADADLIQLVKQLNKTANQSYISWNWRQKQMAMP